MTINEWREDFKSYINELDILKDDYNGIMEYINDGYSMMKEQDPIRPRIEKEITFNSFPNEKEQIYNEYYCGLCGKKISINSRYCPSCGRPVKWE